jgi:hypothetical protein
MHQSLAMAAPGAGIVLRFGALRTQRQQWTSRCSTCQQPVDLVKLLLHRLRHDELQHLTEHY